MKSQEKDGRRFGEGRQQQRETAEEKGERTLKGKIHIKGGKEFERLSEEKKSKETLTAETQTGAKEGEDADNRRRQSDPCKSVKLIINCNQDHHHHQEQETPTLASKNDDETLSRANELIKSNEAQDDRRCVCDLGVRRLRSSGDLNQRRSSVISHKEDDTDDDITIDERDANQRTISKRRSSSPGKLQSIILPTPRRKDAIVSSFPSGRRRTIHEFTLMDANHNHRLHQHHLHRDATCGRSQIASSSSSSSFSNLQLPLASKINRNAQISLSRLCNNNNNNAETPNGRQHYISRLKPRSLSLSPEHYGQHFGRSVSGQCLNNRKAYLASDAYNHRLESISVIPSSSASVTSSSSYINKNSRRAAAAEDVIFHRTLNEGRDANYGRDATNDVTSSEDANVLRDANGKRKKVKKIEDAKDKKKQKKKPKTIKKEGNEFTINLLTSLGSLIYALLLIVLALFFYLLDIMDKTEGLHSAFNAGLCIIGMIYLTYLYFDIQKYKKKIMKKLFPNGIRIPRRYPNEEDAGIDAKEKYDNNYDVNQLNVYDLFNGYDDRSSTATEVLCNNVYCNPIFNERFFNEDANFDANSDDEVFSIESSTRTSANDNQNKNDSNEGINFNVASKAASVISGGDATSEDVTSNFTGWSSPDILIKDNNRRVSSITNVTNIVGVHSSSTDANHDANYIQTSFGDTNQRIKSMTNGHHTNRDMKYDDEYDGDASVSVFKDNHQDQQKMKKKTLASYRFLRGRSAGSFYLKCGMAAFCFGHIIHEGLIFGHQVFYYVTGDVPCQSLSQLIHHSVRPIFSFYQLFICFKYSNIVINRSKILSSFGLMHLFGTSISFWIGTIIDDAVDFYTQHHLNEFVIEQTVPSHNNQTLNNQTTSLINYLINPVISNINSSDHNHNEAHNYILNGESVPGSAAILAIECIQSVSPSISSSKIFPYMYPFTIEYNVCLAVLWYLIWDNIGLDMSCDDVKKQSGGHISNNLTNHVNNENIKMRRKSSIHPSIEMNNLKDIYEHLDMSDEKYDNNHNNEVQDNYKDNYYNYEETGITIGADCHASNKGLFGGLFILLFMIVTMIMFFISLGSSVNFNNNQGVNHNNNSSTYLIDASTKEDHNSNGVISIYIFHIQESLLTILILVSTIISYKHVSKFDILHVKLTSHTTDIILLIVPLIFYFINNILSIAAELTFNNYFRVSLLIFITIQVIFQAVFIIDASHRCIDKGSVYKFKKPGREFITFNILLNITSWIVYTFESKAVEPYLNESAFYGSTFWMIISHTTLPLMLFYRFHCSVCLADIWKFTYDPPSKDNN